MNAKVEVSKSEVEVLASKVEALESKVVELSNKLEEITNKKSKSVKEMTNDDALRILNGDLATKSHKECAEALGLTYGQIYSCRLEFTFKAVHHQLAKTGWKNKWVKAD